MSVHWPLQATSGVGHVHMPLAQMVPPVQLIPQEPQLVGSLPVSTQAPAQSVNPGPQIVVHDPELQNSVGAQIVSHAPQFVGSLNGSTQTPPHRSIEVGHVQTPALQKVPPVQARPQALQFDESLKRSTQAPAQSVRPDP